MAERSYDHPPATSSVVRERMQKQSRSDTDCEMAVRRALWSRGYRYRVNTRPEGDFRRKADLVFRREKVAVFVDGCFWHLCPEHGQIPKSNSTWWERKLTGNRHRDAETTRFLTRNGWTVVRVWEHEDPIDAADAVEQALLEARARSNTV